MFFGGSYFNVVFTSDPGSIGGVITSNAMGPLVDHVNFYTKSTDCFTNLDNTPNDFRLPFGITNIGLFFMAILVIFFLNVEVPKPEKKLSFREEFSWVRNSYKFLLSRFGTCEF